MITGSVLHTLCELFGLILVINVMIIVLISLIRKLVLRKIKEAT